MAKSRQVVVAVGGALLALAACGGESTQSNGAKAASGASGAGAGPGPSKPVPNVGGGGSTLAGAPATSAGQGTAGTGVLLGGATSVGGSDGGAPAEGGDSGTGGDVGQAGAASCPAIKCATSCPGDRWLGLDGCTTCACAVPPPQLTHEAFSCPLQSLTLKATSSYFIGGIDRWDIDFEWVCSAVALGSPSRASLKVALPQPQAVPVDATNRTFYWPKAQGLEGFQLSAGTIWLRGSGVPEIEEPLLPTSAFLSIRREGDELVGGVQYVGEDSAHTHQTTLAGPFRVPVPTF